MKTADSQTRAASPPPIPNPRGEGVAQNAKTNKPQKTGIIAGKKRGGQPGNRNATRPVPSLSRRIRDLNRRINAALRASDALCKPDR